MANLKSKSEAIEDSGHSVMNRITGNSAANITQADITSIAYTVHDTLTGEQTVSGTLSKTTVIFDTLQTDARWTKDSTGYNFRYDIPASELPNGDRTYRFEIVFTPASGAVFTIIREVDVLGLKGS